MKFVFIFAGVLFIASCGSTIKPSEYEKSKIQINEKVILGRVKVLLKKKKDITDKCYLWLEKEGKGLQLQKNGYFVQTVSIDEYAVYELLCTLDTGNLKYKFDRKLTYPRTRARTKNYIGDIKFILYPKKTKKSGEIGIKVTKNPNRALKWYNKTFGKDRLPYYRSFIQQPN